MEQDKISNLFEFCKNNVEDFTVKIVDESEHYYIKDKMVGGYLGDSQKLFIRRSDVLSGLMKDFEKFEKKIEEERKNAIEEMKTENKINLNIITRDRGLGLEIVRVNSSKRLGYIDGPEDPIYELTGVHNLKDLFEHLDELAEISFNFPKNPTFYIDNQKFAVDKTSSIGIEMNDSFPKELIEKYNTKKVFTLSIKENENKSLSVFEGNRAFITKVRGGEGFGSMCRDVVEFKTKDDALKEIVKKLDGNLAILDGEPLTPNKRNITKRNTNKL